MVLSAETSRIASALEPGVRDWVLRGYEPTYGQLADRFETSPRWKALQGTGSELWLDTGDREGIQKLWTREFRALTTNNTLLNNEVQRGQYDGLVRETAARLRELEPSISRDILVLEVAFVLNAHHGLRLVEGFDAYVSVEEHTDLANDIDLAVLYGKRFYAICPERFIVKLPLTPEGLLGMRRLAKDGVPVNFTLGFSARQNYLAARLGNPGFVNVFLGRLNAFISGSQLGTGDGVGEKTTIASQEAMAELRKKGQVKTRQIAASLRNGDQVWTLAGTDVLTMPLGVATEYRDAPKGPATSRGPASADIEVGIEPSAVESLRLDSLWEIPDSFRAAVDALLEQDLDRMTGPGLASFLRKNGAPDLFPAYTKEDLEAFRTDGKIPKLARWRDRLQNGDVSLDSLMNMSGLYSFATDQKDLDDRVRSLLG